MCVCLSVGREGLCIWVLVPVCESHSCPALSRSPQIMKEIQEHKIKIYEFPDTEDDEDSKLIRKIKVQQGTVECSRAEHPRVE